MSTSASRSSSIALQGATLSGAVYVFTSNATNLQNYNPTGVSKVCYWLDNPAMTGTATHCESISPYDFAGTASDGTAYAWDTSKLSQGTHSITQSVTLSTGGNEIDSATFSVNSTTLPPPPSAGSKVVFRNVNSNLCIDTGGSTTATSLIQSACSASTTQQFTLNTSPMSGWYYLASTTPNLCWDIVGGSLSAGALIQQYTCTAVPLEYFQVKPVASGYQILSNSLTNGCVDVVGASTAPGANLEQNTCNGSANQTFQVSTASGSVPVAPSISSQPANQTVTSGQTATFSVAATGTAPMSYQWQKNSAAISGATSSIYTTPVTTSTDNGAKFTVVVSNSAGSATSSAATLTVSSTAVSPSITTQPASRTVTVGQSATFSVAASGTTPMGYQWRKNGASISGAMSSSYATPATTSTDNGTQFTVVISNSAGSVTSSAATLTVNAAAVAPSITTQPASQTVTAGQTATFTVAASGTATLGYQWQKNGGAISGATSSSYSTPATTSTDNGASFTVVVSNSAGSVTSSAATLTVSNSSGGGPTVNVKNYGATGNGSTDDTSAINSAIGALSSGATLSFPCGTYLTSAQLTLNVSNVTVDGSGCAVIHNTSSGTVLVIGGSGNGNPNFGSAVSLSATANELTTSFTTTSSLGVSPGDLVRLQQGGKDSSNGSGDTGCDPSGCRGELLKVASVSGNTITVTTALHDTYNPSVNNATAQKLLSPLTNLNVKNITLDGNGSNVYGLALAGVADSSVTGVTSRNVQGAALLNRGDFNVSWSNISVTGAGSAQCGSAVWFENQGNLQINGLSVSNENQGAPGSGCLYNGAFGFELIASANSTITNLTVDASGAYGRPFKTTASRYNTFNSVTVKNGVQAYNGISLEYYSSHNTYNSCVVTNNGAGTGTGTGNAGIITFGNFNQYNSFNNCTVSGNGNIQILFNSFDALRLAQDSNNTISGGTYTGTNSVEPPVYIEGANVYIKGVTINGPGSTGVLLDSNGTNGCINNNTFMGTTGLGGGIISNSSTNMGAGNTLNGLNSNLTAGTCGPSGVAVSISPTAATMASSTTKQFTATVTGSTNTAVTWSATAGSVSSSGLFTAPAVSANATATVTATSQADASQAASASVIVTPPVPPNTFGYAVQGATIGATMSNSVSATRYQMAGQNGTVTSMSVFIASPVSASPNNQFQVAIYADNNGTPGTLIASSVSQTIVPDAWNTVPITATVTANTYYWLAYNTNGLAANTNNLRYDAGGATSTWISAEPFGTWPALYGPVGGSSIYSTSMYCTFQ